MAAPGTPRRLGWSIEVGLDEATHDALTEIAAERRISRAEIVREAIDLYLRAVESAPAARADVTPQMPREAPAPTRPRTPWRSGPAVLPRRIP